MHNSNQGRFIFTRFKGMQNLLILANFFSTSFLAEKKLAAEKKWLQIIDEPLRNGLLEEAV
jgi:uncharacterized membrane protein